jgi:hypothetical protein
VRAAVDSAMETWDTQRSKLRSMQMTGASRRRRITNQLAMSPTESSVPDDGSSDESTNGAPRMRPDRNGVPLARVWANFDPESQPVCFPHGTPIILEGYPVMSVEAGEVLLCEFSHGKREPIAMMGPSVFWLMRRLCDVGDPKAKVCALLSRHHTCLPSPLRSLLFANFLGVASTSRLPTTINQPIHQRRSSTLQVGYVPSAYMDPLDKCTDTDISHATIGAIDWAHSRGWCWSAFSYNEHLLEKGSPHPSLLCSRLMDPSDTRVEHSPHTRVDTVVLGSREWQTGRVLGEGALGQVSLMSWLNDHDS